MADATQSRSNASRAEEMRLERSETSIAATARMIGEVEQLFSKAGKASSLRFSNTLAMNAIHDGIYSTLCEGQYALLHLIPEGDDRDLMILAGHAAMLADQLPDLIAPGDTHAEKLCEGIKAALRSISATLAEQWPAGPETVDLLFPELARSIRQDVLVTNALRADAEAR